MTSVASSQMIDGVWYFVYDLNNAANILHQFVYEESRASETSLKA